MLNDLGPLSKDEIKISFIFGSAVLAWMTSRVIRETFGIGLEDAGVAIIVAILLFMIPSSNKGSDLMHWDKTTKLPWGLLILFYEMKPIHLPFNRFFNRLQTATELIPSTKKVETLSFVKSFFKPLIVNDVRTNILEINSKTLMKADIRKRPIKIC